MVKIDRAILEAFPLLLPPNKAEQEAIAEALSDADALIEALEQLIAKKRRIKQGVMQALLTGRRRLPGFEVKPGFKQTEVGVIPADWSCVTLGESAFFKTGPFGSSLHKTDYIRNGVPIVNPMHIIEGSIRPSGEMSVTSARAASLRDFRLNAGDIVIGRRGEMGRCAVVTHAQEGWLCGTGSMIIRCFAKTSPHFIQAVLASPKAILSIESASVGTTMVNLNQSVLDGLHLQMPGRAEQVAIAQVLSDHDAEIEALQARLKKTRQLKQGMAQQLLTGKIRLV